MTKKPNPDAKRLADTAIAHAQRSCGFVSESVMEYMAMGLLAQQMALADVSVDIDGLNDMQIQIVEQHRKGREFDLYKEAIALVRAHFNKVEA